MCYKLFLELSRVQDRINMSKEIVSASLVWFCTASECVFCIFAVMPHSPVVLMTEQACGGLSFFFVSRSHSAATPAYRINVNERAGILVSE